MNVPVTRKWFDTFFNTYRFFALDGNVEEWRPSDADPAPADPLSAAVESYEVLATVIIEVRKTEDSVVKTILTHDAFYANAAPPPLAADSKKSVKWPVDLVVSTLRLLGIKLKRRKYQGLALADSDSLRPASSLPRFGHEPRQSSA